MCLPSEAALVVEHLWSQTLCLAQWRPYRGISTRQTLQCSIDAHPGKSDFPHILPKFVGEAPVWPDLLTYHEPSNQSVHLNMLGHSCSFHILTKNLTESPTTTVIPKLKNMPLPSEKSQTRSDSNKPVATSHLTPVTGDFGWVLEHSTAWPS